MQIRGTSALKKIYLKYTRVYSLFMLLVVLVEEWGLGWGNGLPALWKMEDPSKWIFTKTGAAVILAEFDFCVVALKEVLKDERLKP